MVIGVVVVSRIRVELTDAYMDTYLMDMYCFCGDKCVLFLTQQVRLGQRKGCKGRVVPCFLAIHIHDEFLLTVPVMQQKHVTIISMVSIDDNKFFMFWLRIVLFSYSVSGDFSVCQIVVHEGTSHNGNVVSLIRNGNVGQWERRFPHSQRERRTIGLQYENGPGKN